MLLRPGSIPTGTEWAFEVKWDGFRAVVSTEDGLRVRSRRGWNMTPHVVRLDVVADAVPWEPAAVLERHSSLITPSRRMGSASRVVMLTRVEKELERVPVLALHAFRCTFTTQSREGGDANRNSEAVRRRQRPRRHIAVRWEHGSLCPASN